MTESGFTPYLTISEAAELARVSPKRIRNLMTDGTLREGVHFTRPQGLGPRFKRAALIEWLESGLTVEQDTIPMARRGRQRDRVGVA